MSTLTQQSSEPLLQNTIGEIPKNASIEQTDLVNVRYKCGETRQIYGASTETSFFLGLLMVAEYPYGDQ